MKYTLVYNASIYTPQDQGGPLRGSKQGSIRVYNPGAMLIVDGIIEDIGPQTEVLPRFDRQIAQCTAPSPVSAGSTAKKAAAAAEASGAAAAAEVSAAAANRASTGSPASRTILPVIKKIDAAGRTVIPGLVDPHTHLCFAATREEEFRMRLAGADYMEIHKKGGGIMSSVRSLREAAQEDILQQTLTGLHRSLGFGVTTVEIKTGYGLSTQAELLQLAVIQEAGYRAPQSVVPTFLGAHSIPAEYKQNRGKFLALVINEMLPAAAGTGIPLFCDVFTEEAVFTVPESERILQAARNLGLGLKAHVDEIVNLGGAAMAARLGCVSAEHLIAADDQGLAAMAEAGTIAVVLPGTSFSLKKPYARARKMIELGVPVALATDCNPGSCYTENLLFIYTLAVMQLGLSTEEALSAVTLNSAYAIGCQKTAGSLEIGKPADFVVLDGASPAIIPYHVAVNPVLQVYKHGELMSL